MQDLLYSFEKFALCQRCVVLPLKRSNGLFQNWNKMRLSQWCGSGSGLSHKTWSHFRFAIFLIQDKTQVLQSSHSRLNSGENISKQIKIICFSWIFNFIALVFFSQILFYFSVGQLKWLEPHWIDMPYLSSFLNSIHMFLAFTILKFINGIPFSSL